MDGHLKYLRSFCIMFQVQTSHVCLGIFEILKINVEKEKIFTGNINIILDDAT